VARLVRPLSAVVALTLASLLLASCGTGGAVADVRHSCVFVKRALVLEEKSEQVGLTARQRHTLQKNALNEMLRGTRSAAAATSIDGSWNPLMTEINEAERVPIPDLKASLTRLCKVADSSSPYM
jgi:hypothetical protein